MVDQGISRSNSITIKPVSLSNTVFSFFLPSSSMHWGLSLQTGELQLILTASTPAGKASKANKKNKVFFKKKELVTFYLISTVKFLKIYKEFLTTIPPDIEYNVLNKGVVIDDVKKAKTLNELYNFVRSDDIFNGGEHKYDKSLYETVAEVAAAKAFKHIYPDKGLDEMEFKFKEGTD